MFRNHLAGYQIAQRMEPIWFGRNIFQVVGQERVLDFHDPAANTCSSVAPLAKASVLPMTRKSCIFAVILPAGVLRYLSLWAWEIISFTHLANLAFEAAVEFLPFYGKRTSLFDRVWVSPYAAYNELTLVRDTVSGLQVRRKFARLLGYWLVTAFHAIFVFFVYVNSTILSG